MAANQLSARENAVFGYREDRYDRSSGLTFTETTVRGRPYRRSHWRPNYLQDTVVAFTPLGPPSLEDVALRGLLRYMNCVTMDTKCELIEILRCLPLQIGKKARKVAKDSDLHSPLAVWQAFIAAYPGEECMKYHQTSIRAPYPDELPIYIDRINSESFAWITCLTLTEHADHVVFRRPDVINISRIRNLVALKISSSLEAPFRSSLVDDNVMRSWSRRVEETRAFPKLQVLVLQNQSEVTARSLRFLNAFPCLAVYAVPECFHTANQDIEVANSLAWTIHDEESVMLAIDSALGSDNMIHQLFKSSCNLIPLNISGDEPLLNIRLGPVPRTISASHFKPGEVFFRRPPNEILPVQQSSPFNATAEPQLVEPQHRTQQIHAAKRRRLKKQVDLSGCLDDLSTPVKSKRLDEACHPV